MGNPVPIPPPGFERLSIEEKIEYVQSLWDRIAADVDSVPLAEWQKQLLDERLKDLDDNPGSGIPWPQVRAGVLRKLGKRGA
jgi:putative addiction module component (TIGR02574 family)